MKRHHMICEWHLDQYPWECTCGLTAPKAEWFDAEAKEYEERMGIRKPNESSDEG